MTDFRTLNRALGIACATVMIAAGGARAQQPVPPKTQIWIAISTYLLIAIAKKRLHLDHHSLYEIIQILSLSMFETIPINQLLTSPSTNSDPDFESNQLALL